MPEILIDTNILIYAYDSTTPIKQRRAIEVLDHIRTAQNGVVTASGFSKSDFIICLSIDQTYELPNQATHYLQVDGCVCWTYS